MSKNKQGKTAKKRASAGERIMCNFYPMSIEEIRRQDTNTGTYASHYARKIDRAIRAAVKEAWESGKRYKYLELGDYAGADYIVEEIENKYGVKL